MSVASPSRGCSWSRSILVISFMVTAFVTGFMTCVWGTVTLLYLIHSNPHGDRGVGTFPMIWHFAIPDLLKTISGTFLSLFNSISCGFGGTTLLLHFFSVLVTFRSTFSLIFEGFSKTFSGVSILRPYSSAAQAELYSCPLFNQPQ